MESEKFPKIQYYEAVRPKHSEDEAILSQFSEKEQKEIVKKQELLSVLAYFIGRDFQMPILLNAPGARWHWNFKDNHIKIDTKDLLEKPMDYLRFVICHEGGHRRVSRTDFIPKEVWNQTGFPFLMNAIEDPRMNNFVADAYSAFEKYMEFAYEHDFELAEKSRIEAKGKLGYVPQHLQAGWEYIRLWFYDRKNEPVEIAPHLPEDVKEVIKNTLAEAKDSWWTYPSKQQADKNEKEISRFAESSYKINYEQIWPEFKKLVEDDKKTQEMQESLKGMQKKGGEGDEKEGKSIPKELKNKLSEDEEKALEKALDEAIKKNLENKADKEKTRDKSESEKGENGEGGLEKAEKEDVGEEGSPVDIDSLPESLKQKIREYIESLPEDKKKELKDKAEKALKEVSKEVSKAIEGQFEQAESESGEKGKEKEGGEKEDSEKLKSEELKKEQGKKDKEKREAIKKDLEDFREKAQKVLEKNLTPYDRDLSLVAPIITSLENELRQIFVARRGSHWETGYKFGKKIDIKKRIQEKAKDVSVFDSRSWQKRELPKEKDYAISLLVDLSGSMRGVKIKETFKAVIVLAEVLNKLGIKTEILGFNDKLHEYQKFGEKMSNDIRSKIGTMLKEVDSDGARYNDDGWALGETSTRLEKEKDIDEKILIVLSDGTPEESDAHSGGDFNLDKVVKKIVSKHSQRLIGLGIGRGTEHVKRFYPQSIADIDVIEMASQLAGLIKDVIEHPQKA
jgi:cobalamin biosynthesis protein CobT